jgi:hypothetical protein
MIVLGAGPSRPLSLGRGGQKRAGGGVGQQPQRKVVVAGAGRNKWKGETKIHSSMADGNNGEIKQHRGFWSFGNNNDNRSKHHHQRPNRVAYGPVQRGGSLHDIAIHDASGVIVSAPRSNSPWSQLRHKSRMLRRGLIGFAVRGVNLNSIVNFGGSSSQKHQVRVMDGRRSNSNNNKLNFLRIGGFINRSKRRMSRRGVRMETVDTLDLLGSTFYGGGAAFGTEKESMDGERYLEAMSIRDTSSSATTTAAQHTDASSKRRWSVLKRFDRSDKKMMNKLEARRSLLVSTSTRGGSNTSSTTQAAAMVSTTSSTRSKSFHSSSSTASLSSSSTASEPETWVIETPLFPLILPKSWEPPTTAVTASMASTATSVVEEGSSTTFMEISVAIEQDTTSTTTITDVASSKPSLQMLKTATQPLIPKSVWENDFTGNEFYFPESMEMLALTGIQMAGNGNDDVVNWVGEKKTVKFLEDYGSPDADDGSTTDEEDLDGIGSIQTSKLQPQFTKGLVSTQEVLVWAGKFTSSTNRNQGNGEGYGAELPIIKTMSIINKSPKDLAELLMDSEKVKMYNKMSLGRSDEVVFQTGV